MPSCKNKKNHNKSRKNGFTLAEVLITLGVIGVVAALTLPSVISNYKEREYIAKLKKSYSILNQAFTAAIVDNETVDNWCEKPLDNNQCAVNMLNILSKHMNVSQSCVFGDGKCFSKKYHNYDLSNDTGLFLHRAMITSDGIAYGLNITAGDGYTNNWCKTTTNDLSISGYYDHCGYIYVDVTGPKSPNVFGKDLFIFKIFKNGVRPGGISDDTVWTETFKNQCLGEKVYGLSKAWCAGWVIMNDNMDYWHCKDLDWNGKKKCK